MLDFYLDLIPPTMTSQQKGVDFGRRRFFTKEQLQEIERMYCGALVPHRPRERLTGPLKAEITFTWPWREGEAAKRRQWGWWPKDTKPDCSNSVKLFEDCLTIVEFFRDDAQIASLLVKKGWGNRPGIRVKLSRWEFDPTDL